MYTKALQPCVLVADRAWRLPWSAKLQYALARFKDKHHAINSLIFPRHVAHFLTD
jgi:hypothetical protein